MKFYTETPSNQNNQILNSATCSNNIATKLRKIEAIELMKKMILSLICHLKGKLHIEKNVAFIYHYLKAL